MSNMFIAMLVAFVLAIGLYFDQKEEEAAKAFMAQCRQGSAYRDCLVLWRGDTYVFEGESL
jgi:hypothetical protein